MGIEVFTKKRKVDNMIKQEFIEDYRHELQTFREKTRAFYAGEVSVGEYKGFSGYYGSYAQRGADSSMLRLRMTAGEMDKEKLAFIADSIEKYNIDKVHFTTCQTVQLHNLSCEDVCSLIEEALDAGIVTRGGGGDFPRNTMCSPLSGVEEDEYFDVMPYAKETGDYVLTLMKDLKLPRKLKIGFSNSPKNVPHATFRDLGFVATPKKTFDVYCAGGLGNKPKFGVKVVEDLDPSKVLYCVQTMVDIFKEHGNYKQRGASRTRFLQDTMGVDGLREAFQKKLEENLAKLSLTLHVTENGITKTGTTENEAEFLAEQPRVVKQKQPGLYAVLYHPIGGTPDAAVFRTLSDAIADMDEVVIRIAPTEGIYIINLTKEEAEKILALTPDSAKTAFERSSACIGADICQVGIGTSQILLNQCVERVRKENFADGVLPVIHISGCPSSCSTHQTAAIGFRGGKKPTADGPQDAFAIYENGCDLQGQERMGEELGVMLAKDIPEFLVELGKAVEAEQMDYATFRQNYPEKVKEIIAKYV